MEIRPRTTFICRHCDRECKNEYYAIDPQGAKICDECAYSSDLRMVENDKKIFGYLVKSKDKNVVYVSNWPGRKIASVVAYYEKYAGHCGKQTYILAISENGRLLSGRGPGIGMYCTLRPIKHWPKDVYHWEAEQMFKRYSKKKG